MGAATRSALFAGFIAGFVWMFIADLAGGFTPVINSWIGLAFLVATAIVTAIIMAIVNRTRNRSA